MLQLKFTTAIIFLLLLIGFSACQCNYEGRFVKDVVQTENGLTLLTNEGEIQLTALTDHSVEVEYIQEGLQNDPSYSIAPSISIVNTTVSESRTSVVFSTKGIRVEIRKCPFTIAYYHGDSLLFTEEQGLVYNDSIKGFRMKLQADEKLLGGGERVLGMDRRGKRLRLYNQASYGYQSHADLMYYSLPVVLSSRKYMLVFDNVADGWLDLGKTDTDILQFDAEGGRMSYVVVAGDGYRNLTENYVETTGYQPMPPRWALGNISSRMGYKSQKEVEQVVAQYKKEGFPLDAMVLDLYWFGPDLQGHMGNLEWDRKAFPQPEQMMSKLKKEGVKTILITEPFVLKNSGKYAECASQNLLGLDSLAQPYIFDFYFGTTALLDIFKPETKDWFWGIYKKHTLSGVDGWWGDLGEPEMHPDDLLHVNGKANIVHNAYGHEWAKTVFDGYQKDFSETRPVILMRSGFVGSQRYGMIPWSGDVSRSWEGLQSQVEISLQMGLQGLAYMHSDLGGFAGNYKDAELYTRWLQYGVFQPVYRTHAQSDVPPEPIFWDKQTKEITRQFIKLRYAFLPYIYTMVYENSALGTPLMRPLFYMDDNRALIDNKNTYLWGDNFLVSPVTQKGVREWKVTLPKGCNWFNYFTGELVEGGQEVMVPVSINNIPVFVKGGSFIPMVEPVDNMEEYSTENLILHYYYDSSLKQSEGFMYEDDGKTNNSWKNNQFEKLFFKSVNKKDGFSVVVTREAFDYEGKPEGREITLVIHNIQEEPKEVKINDTNISFIYHKEKQQFSLHTEMKGSEKVEIMIK
jgi:oligosaccharide 4-alpha-D-glucosyltransferase